MSPAEGGGYFLGKGRQEVACNTYKMRKPAERSLPDNKRVLLLQLFDISSFKMKKWQSTTSKQAETIKVP